MLKKVNLITGGVLNFICLIDNFIKPFVYFEDFSKTVYHII